MSKTITIMGALALGASAGTAHAADVLNAGTGVPFTIGAATYTEDFNSLKSVTSDPTSASTLPAGWQAYESGSAANDSYQFGSASSNTPGVWSYGSGSDRALGGHNNTQVSTIFTGAVFRNGLDQSINSLAIAYTGEQWQKGFNRATMRFEYSLDATAINNGSWMSVSALDFLAPNADPYRGSQFGISSTNGNSAAYRTAIAGTIDGLAIGAGETFAIRWTLTDIDPTGVTSDDGLAVDDFSLTAGVAAVPEASTWAMMLIGFGAVGRVMRRRRPQSRVALA